MKLMANGALTLATMDGATVEIHDYVGKDYIYIFGMTNDEVQTLNENRTYHSRHLYETNPRINKVLNMLVDGSIPNTEEIGQDIFDSLVKYNDEYYLLQDFDSYIEAHKRADTDFKDRMKWNKKALMNIANAGPFSADYTIHRYADEIWKMKPGEENILLQPEA